MRMTTARDTHLGERCTSSGRTRTTSGSMTRTSTAQRTTPEAMTSLSPRALRLAKRIALVVVLAAAVGVVASMLVPLPEPDPSLVPASIAGQTGQLEPAAPERPLDDGIPGLL